MVAKEIEKKKKFKDSDQNLGKPRQNLSTKMITDLGCESLVSINSLIINKIGNVKVTMRFFRAECLYFQTYFL